MGAAVQDHCRKLAFQGIYKVRAKTGSDRIDVRQIKRTLDETALTLQLLMT